MLPPLPGLWQGATAGASAAFSHVTYLTPFALRSTTPFMPLRHPELSSARYATDFNEVKTIGKTIGVWKGNTVGAVTNPDVERSYASFSQLALQEADRRIWGGIHFRFDNGASLEMCPKAVVYAYERRMRPLH